MQIFENCYQLNQQKFGYLSFNIGIFFLFSAPAIGSFFLIISLFFSVFFFEKEFYKDKINIFLVIVSILMITICLAYQFNSQDEYLDYSTKLNTHPLIGLVNWIPLFFSFVGFQNYLKTQKSRLNFGLCLIFGSIPILISGFGQYLFSWYGPLDFFHGLIVWYQRENTTGMTSLFNNANYAACALATTFPFLCASFCKNRIFDFKKIINLFLIILVIIAIIFTSSRNGLIGLILGTLIFLIPLKSRIFSFGFLLFGSILFFNFVGKIFLDLTLIPENLLRKISFMGIFNDPRILIWENAIKYISQKPFFGWGGNSFSSLWNKENELYLGHSHSIPLEISIQYGIITSLILSTLVIFILIKSFRFIFLESNMKLISFYKENYFDRAWFASCIVILFSNVVDIVYFDIRISALTWILIAGLRSISKREIKNYL
tara:strand:+ start:561 stop:1853 length:1293 start_codon:yes stop_codon:yes gene_type:complete